MSLLRFVGSRCCRPCTGAFVAALGLAMYSQAAIATETIVVEAKLHHLRSGETREWDEFPEEAERRELVSTFVSTPNDTPQTLRLRQQDVKQKWQVVLNDEELGRLTIDENDMALYFDVPQGLLRAKNSIAIRPMGKHRSSDDIRVGEITLIDKPRAALMSESRIHFKVRTDGEFGPCRITILEADGALAPVGPSSNDHLAVRPGTIYTTTGEAEIELPAGKYEVICGRGFEYSIARATTTIEVGERQALNFPIRRLVNTKGWVACDTHVHSRTHSGHGDATVQERMVTLAGEGIELPISTDHNVHVDHNPFAREMKVRQYFTPVIGNEVTTKTGHFNIFPVVKGSPPPPHKSEEWKVTLDGIFATKNVKVAILNHARDVHGGTTPFGPKRFNDAAGEILDDWHVGFNAMEVVNSGATRTDPLQLLHDWMTLLNRGRRITPVGSSDSHDVSRYIVGQGRTYIRCDDSKPDKIDVVGAVDAFVRGRVMVSYGLLAEMRVNETGQSGDDVAVTGDSMTVDVVVRGPFWVKADTLQLYANGELAKEISIDNEARRKLSPGEIFRTTMTLPKPKHDVHLVAVATGPGIDRLYWPTAKPYQPDSTTWKSRTLGCSGAIFIDADGDGEWSSAHDYATKIVRVAHKELPTLIQSLNNYDAAVATQAALLLHRAGTPPLHLLDRDLLDDAAPTVSSGFAAYVKAWRANEQARQ